MRAKEPTRTISVLTLSPDSFVIVPGYLEILPDSVISRCNSNQRLSISSMVASWLEVPIFFANSPIHSPRLAYWLEMRDPSKPPRVSPATCWRTPKSSRRLPRRLSSCSVKSPMRISFSSNWVSSRSERRCSRRRSASASCNKRACSAFSFAKRCSRAVFSRDSTTRRACTFSKSSSKELASFTTKSLAGVALSSAMLTGAKAAAATASAAAASSFVLFKSCNVSLIIVLLPLQLPASSACRLTLADEPCEYPDVPRLGKNYQQTHKHELLG